MESQRMKTTRTKRNKWAKNGCLEEFFSHGDFPAATAAVFKLKERPGSGMWGYVPSLPERIVLTEKISTTEIRVIIFQLKWSSAAANLSASERSEKKAERNWWGDVFFFIMSPIWARSGPLYYLTVRVYFVLLLAITSSPILYDKRRKKLSLIKVSVRSLLLLLCLQERLHRKTLNNITAESFFWGKKKQYHYMWSGMKIKCKTFNLENYECTYIIVIFCWGLSCHIGYKRNMGKKALRLRAMINI